MKVPGILLLVALSCSQAQLPPGTLRPSPSAPGSPRYPEAPSSRYPGSYSRVHQADPIVDLYQGPLYPAEGEAEMYRPRLAALTRSSMANEVPAPGSAFVGFDCTVMPGGRANVLASLVPSYSVSGQRVAGRPIGTKYTATPPLTAREGYAVARMEVWLLLGEAPYESPLERNRTAAPAQRPAAITGLRITFARMETGGTLSATDQYISPLVGSDNGQAQMLDTMGIVPCGLIASYTAKPSALGLLLPAAIVKAQRPALVPVAAVAATGIAGQLPVLPAAPGSLPPPAQPELPGAPAIPGGPLLPGAPATPVATLEQVDASGVPTDPLINELASKASASFAFVEGEEGAGSAFVCIYQGKRVLLTNQHVVRENPALKLTLLNQSVVKLGAARAAVGHDLIAFDIDDPIPGLQADLDFATNVSLGDEVLVIGNTEGQRVIKALPGVVAGVGPNLVENTSKFMPGNSGSPIIHVKSGRVIGIATYAVIRTVDSLTGVQAPSVRRFGYRLDSVQQWQPVNWQAYQAEAAATTKVRAFSGSIVTLLRDMRLRTFDPSNYATDGRLRTALGFLQPLMKSGNKVQADINHAIQNFLGELKNVSQRDVEALRPQLRYDFFQREMNEEARMRGELAKALAKALETLGRR